MNNKYLKTNLSVLTESITSFDEIDLVYYYETIDNNEASIECNIIYNSQNIVENLKIMKAIAKYHESCKNICNKLGIKYGIVIRTYDDFDTKYEEEAERFETATIMYSKHQEINNKTRK